MKKTALLCADWIAMVSIMDDATAGRLLKQLLAIMNDSDSADPDDLKFVLAHIRKFWSDQDVAYQQAVEQRRQAALSRWHKSDVNATACERIQPNASGCINNTNTVTVTNTVTSTNKNKIKNNKKIKNKIINYTGEFEKFWSSYPKKKGKQDAFREREALVSAGVDPAMLIKKAGDYATECKLKHTEESYIIRPQRFLSYGRYDDDFDIGGHRVDLSAVTDDLDSIFGSDEDVKKTDTGGSCGA